MNLQDHARGHALGGERHLDLDHGALDQIRLAPLDDGIDRHALRRLTQHTIARAQIGQVAPASPQRRDVAALLGLRHGAIQKAPHTLVALEVGVDHLLRLAGRDPQLIRQTEGGRPVDDAEVHRLGSRALVRRHLERCDPRHLGRRAAMNVLALLEGFDQARVARVVGEDPQLDL